MDSEAAAFMFSRRVGHSSHSSLQSLAEGSEDERRSSDASTDTQLPPSCHYAQPTPTSPPASVSNSDQLDPANDPDLDPGSVDTSPPVQPSHPVPPLYRPAATMPSPAALLASQRPRQQQQQSGRGSSAVAAAEDSSVSDPSRALADSAVALIPSDGGTRCSYAATAAAATAASASVVTAGNNGNKCNYNRPSSPSLPLPPSLDRHTFSRRAQRRLLDPPSPTLTSKSGVSSPSLNTFISHGDSVSSLLNQLVSPFGVRCIKMSATGRPRQTSCPAVTGRT